MSDAPWVRFFPSDWLAGTRGMSAAETGVYITLVAMMYESREPIRDDAVRLARLCGLPVPAFRKILGALISGGKIVQIDSRLWNDRVEREANIRDEKTSSARNSAKRRWAKNPNISMEESCERNAGAMRAQCYPEPDTRKKERMVSYDTCPVGEKSMDLFAVEPSHPIAKPTEPAKVDHDRFAEFWQTYPKRLGTNSRKDASIRFARAVKSGADPGTLILGAARYAAHCDETGKTGTDKVQQTTTWLNQQNWETDYGKPQPQHQTAAGRPASAGNAHIANAVRSLEMREHRFTDPVTGAFDRDAADADDRDRIDRARAQLFPATFGHRPR